MAARKTDPEPFPVRGTPSGYRDRWEADDSAIIQAMNAERERLIIAVRESAGPYDVFLLSAPIPSRVWLYDSVLRK
jgi:hypothetical protein